MPNAGPCATAVLASRATPLPSPVSSGTTDVVRLTQPVEQVQQLWQAQCQLGRPMAVLIIDNQAATPSDSHETLAKHLRGQGQTIACAVCDVSSGAGCLHFARQMRATQLPALLLFSHEHSKAAADTAAIEANTAAVSAAQYSGGYVRVLQPICSAARLRERLQEAVAANEQDMRSTQHQQLHHGSAGDAAPASRNPRACNKADAATSCALQPRGTTSVASDQQRQSEQASRHPASAANARRFDPPHKGAKAGALRAFELPAAKGSSGRRGRRVTGVYWPKMTCLQCGCPWWSGEDWDAVCVRCGWCCLHEGYDDDSRPLQAGGWAAKHAEFAALIKQGRTAPWPAER